MGVIDCGQVMECVLFVLFNKPKSKTEIMCSLYNIPFQSVDFVLSVVHVSFCVAEPCSKYSTFEKSSYEWKAGILERAGTDPGMECSETKDRMAIIARRPLLSSLVLFLSITSLLTPEKSIFGKTISGKAPPFM